MLNRLKKLLSVSEKDIADGQTYESVTENIKLVSKDSPALLALVKRYESGDLTQEQFIASSVSTLSKEIIRSREELVRVDVMTW